MTKTISNTEDILDVRDIIERYEELEALEDEREGDEQEEFKQLAELLDDLKGNGGDHQWGGDWYPVTLIHEDYFIEYTKELCVDCGYINADKDNELPWWIEVDWEKTAKNMLMDYIEVDFDGQTYYTR